MDESDLKNDLTGLIYDTAIDPAFWPIILEGFSHLMEEQPDDFLYTTKHQPSVQKTIPAFDKYHLDSQPPHHTTQLDHTDTFNSEKKLVDFLVPHLQRAYELNRHIAHIEKERDILKNFYNHVPVGVIIIDNNKKILQKNNAATELIAECPSLSIQMGQLKISGNMLDSGFKRLQEASQKSKNTDSHVSIILGGIEPDCEITLYICKPQRKLSTTVYDELYTLFLTSNKQYKNISLAQLIATFGLTKKEADIARQLACGLSPKVIASITCVEYSTIRSHLKNIYQKTGAHNQNSLAFTILSSPAAWCGFDKDAESRYIPKKYTLQGFYREDMLTLRDGRTLAFAEFGDLRGYPVYLFHSNFGCRYERLPFDKITASHEVRLIIPDRPGFGLSDYNPDYSYTSWAYDLLELSNRLDTETFSIMTFFGGAPEALACALRFPEQLNKVMLFSSFCGISSPREFDGMPSVYRFFLNLAFYAPYLVRKFMQLYIRGMQKVPYRFLEQVSNKFPASDRALLDVAEIKDILATVIFESGVKSNEGFINDVINIVRPWGLPLEDVTMEIDLFYGEQDFACRREMGERLAAVLPRGKQHLLPDAGAFCLLTHWETMLDFAKTKRH